MGSNLNQVMHQRLRGIETLSKIGELFRHVGKFRQQVTTLYGADAPGSAATLMDTLAHTEDPLSRDMLYQSAIDECLWKDCNTAAERIAIAYHEECQDIVSQITLSKTLSDVGKPSEGLASARAALNQAMSEGVLVNYAAGNLMRLAVKTGSAATVNDALEDLEDSTQVPRTEDCALETDWIDAAEALGADKELTDWVREVATMKGFAPKNPPSR